MDTRNIWNETMAWLAAERLHWAALRAGGACALNQGRLGRSFCGVKIAGAYWPGRPHPCQPIPAVSFISLSLPGCGHHCPAGYVPLQPAAHHSPLSTPHYPATIIANRHLTSPRLASPRLALPNGFSGEPSRRHTSSAALHRATRHIPRSLPRLPRSPRLHNNARRATAVWSTAVGGTRRPLPSAPTSQNDAPLLDTLRPPLVSSSLRNGRSN
jgi:hypothetical protein